MTGFRRHGNTTTALDTAYGLRATTGKGSTMLYLSWQNCPRVMSFRSDQIEQVRTRREVDGMLDLRLCGRNLMYTREQREKEQLPECEAGD